MSINAISSVSLYEYYYRINDDKKKEDSQTAKELKKLGINPSDDEAKNVAMLNEAKKAQEQENSGIDKEISPKDRPWADIMDQLGLAFNNDPKDDVKSIHSALNGLISDIEDSELLADIKDLDDYIKSLYITYYHNDFDSDEISNSLSRELEGISAINKASIF